MLIPQFAENAPPDLRCDPHTTDMEDDLFDAVADTEVLKHLREPLRASKT